MRLITKLWATLLLLCVAGVASAATEYEVDQRFTSISDLDGKSFAIVDETPTTPTAMGIGITGHGQGWDMYFGTITEAFNSNACFYKLEAVTTEGLEGYYYLRTYKADGNMYTAWGNTTTMGYFNSQFADKSCCFALGLEGRNGQDGTNLAIWAIEESEGKFALKNIGTGLYLHADNLPAKYEDAFYFTFCSLKEKAQTDPLASEKDDLSTAIAKGKMIKALAYTDATFGALTTAITDGETALASTEATATSLTNATNAITNAIEALALKAGFTSLQDVDFGVFNGWGAEATLTQKVAPTWDLFKATGQSYGDPSVNNRADISAFDKLYVVAVSGSPRILMNRDADNGQWNETEAESHLIDNTKGGWSAKYFSTEDGITTVDLKQLVADKGFAHLTAIKSYDNNVISGLYLYKEATVANEDVLPIDIQFGEGYNNKTVQNYTSTWTATKDGKTWTIVNFNNNNNGWKSIKCGSKNDASVATITSPAINAVVKSYIISLTKASNINSAKLTIMNGEEKVGEDIDITEQFVAGDVVVPVESQKGYSYVLTIDNKKASGNGSVEISKITLSGEAIQPVEPTHIANTAETAYTVAEAIALIDAGDALNETVFVKGFISKIEKVNVDAKDATKNYITYWISADGTEEGQQFQCFKGKTMEGVAYDDIKVGAEVIVTGTMTKYQNTTYEFNSGNTLVSYKAPVVPNPWIAPVIAGEDPVSGNNYKVMNVGSGKFLAMGKAWFSWSTTAIVAEDGFSATFTGDNGSFTLTNTGNGKYVFTSGNDIQGDAMHADGANATSYGLTQLANGNYRIHDAGGNSESPCWGYNSDFHATGIVAHADASAEGWNCEWIFVGDNAANLFAAKTALYNALLYAAENGVDTNEASAVYANSEATIDELKAAAEKLTHTTNFAVNTANAVEGADMTYTIVNPSFETGTTKGWSYETSNDHGAKENSNGTYTMTNCDGKYLFNIWSSGNQISQTIEDLPNGTYKMTAVVATDGGHKVQLNANGKSIQIDATDKGVGVEGELEFDVLDHKATIGAEGVDKYWYKVDNFRLTFVKGINLDELIAAYDAALTAAQAVEGNMNADVKAALDAAIAANNNVDKADVNALTAAITALTEVANAATASVAAYAKAEEVLPKMKQLVDATNVYTAEALDNYYSKWVAKLEAKTLTSDEANALQDPFLVTGWHANITVDNFLLSAWDTNPDFNNAAYYINTWSTEGVEGSNNYAGVEFGVPFFEYFADAANSLAEKTLTATMNGLEAGNYDVTALVRVELKNDATESTGITLQVNEGEAVNAADGDQVGTSKFYIKEVTATGTVGEDGVLNIKFNVAAENTIHWLSFKNVKFEKKAVEIAHTWDFTKWSDATVANLKADAAASKVAGWSDVEKKADAEAGADPTEASKDNCFWAVIPEGGELTANGVAIEELKGLQFGATFAGNRSLAIAVNYAVADASKDFGPYNGPAYLWLGGAGFECFTIPAVKGGTKITMGVESHKITDARGVQLFAGETELKDAEGNAVAAPTTYTEQTWAVPAGVAYDIVVKNTKGCHIYFIDAEQDEATLTSISTVKSNVMNNAIYNLNGQKVNKAHKGLFIINGKKVVK